MLQEIKSEPQTRKKEKEETVVTIKAGGKSYVDVVKKLKDEVDIGKIGVKIGKIRKTGNEDLMLVVEGGQQMASTLEKEIKNKIENIKVVTQAKEMTTLYIIGMDPTSNEEEVEQAIARETNLRETEIQVKGKIRRTDSNSRVAQRKSHCLNPAKENANWMGGMRAKVDRSDECYKCGSKGHRSKECKNEEKCTKCNVAGHRADQIKCPYFRKMVEQKRKEKIESMRKNGGAKTKGEN
ncbi:Zinc knuckle [Popillia japonica]|uniref:Zinc knuckle n=1 Tax=Popillia japonica TaxID=7064 RepID=A0AAW1N4T5_POPJA